jgi:hypothetical protein
MNHKGSPSANRPGEKPEEFSQFESLTRKLARVPKAEIDKKRKTAALRRGR